MRMLPRLVGMLLTAALWALSPAARAQVPDVGWDPILTQVSEEDARRLRGRVAFSVPEVYELAAIILSLTPAGPELVTQTDYVREVREYFAPYADHPAVAALAVNSRTEDWFAAYDFRENAYVYCFSEEAADRIVRCGHASHVWGRQSNSFARNVRLVEDFARVSRFRDFYAAHAAFYRSEETAWRERAPVEAMWAWLETRFPERIQHYAIVFSPLVRGWHSTQVFEDEGFAEAVMFLEPATGIGGQAARVVFTEIDHNYVNRATERYAERNTLDAFDPRFWSSAGANGAYPSAEAVFNEYMTWAVFLLWAREHYDPSTYAGVQQAAVTFMQDRRGFGHFGAFTAELQRLYSAQRRRTNIPALYPTLFAWAGEYMMTPPHSR